MSKGIIYVMTTVVPELIIIGKTGIESFESRMYTLERNGYSNVVGLKRRFAIEVEDYDEKERLLNDIFSKSHVPNTELFALDIDLVVQLLSSFDGKLVYPETMSKEDSFNDATKERQIKDDWEKTPDSTYYMHETRRGNNLSNSDFKTIKELVASGDYQDVIAIFERETSSTIHLSKDRPFYNAFFYDESGILKVFQLIITAKEVFVALEKFHEDYDVTVCVKYPSLSSAYGMDISSSRWEECDYSYIEDFQIGGDSMYGLFAYVSISYSIRLYSDIAEDISIDLLIWIDHDLIEETRDIEDLFCEQFGMPEDEYNERDIIEFAKQLYEESTHAYQHPEIV